MEALRMIPAQEPLRIEPLVVHGTNNGRNWLISTAMVFNDAYGFVSHNDNDPEEVFLENFPGGVSFRGNIKYFPDITGSQLVSESFYGFDHKIPESLKKDKNWLNRIPIEDQTFGPIFNETCDAVLTTISKLTGKPKGKPGLKWAIGNYGRVEWAIQFEKNLFTLFFSADHIDLFAISNFLGFKPARVFYPNPVFSSFFRSEFPVHSVDFPFYPHVPFSFELDLGDIFKLMNIQKEKPANV